MQANYWWGQMHCGAPKFWLDDGPPGPHCSAPWSASVTTMSPVCLSVCDEMYCG